MRAFELLIVENGALRRLCSGYGLGRMDGEELTQQETELYDRQIRVWGVDAQRRSSPSSFAALEIFDSPIAAVVSIVLLIVGNSLLKSVMFET